MATDARRARFHDLHRSDDLFVMPNPWDVGSARMLADAGFPALATTSAGFAGTLGRRDGEVGLEELLRHTVDMSAAVNVPLNVDSERCFADTTDGVEEVVRQLADAGAAGCSIEDWNPDTQSIDTTAEAVARTAAAAAAADDAGIVLTARAENHLHDIDDLDDTIARLIAFRDAGAHCLYAPGLIDIGDIRRVVAEVAAPVNVLLMPGGPDVAQLRDAGVRRVSTGSALYRVAYAAALDHARHLG